MKSAWQIMPNIPVIPNQQKSRLLIGLNYIILCLNNINSSQIAKYELSLQIASCAQAF